MCSIYCLCPTSQFKSVHTPTDWFVNLRCFLGVLLIVYIQHQRYGQSNYLFQPHIQWFPTGGLWTHRKWSTMLSNLYFIFYSLNNLEKRRWKNKIHYYGLKFREKAQRTINRCIKIGVDLFFCLLEFWLLKHSK